MVQDDFWRSLLTLILASLVVMGSPGPATMSVTSVGAAFGWRRATGYLAGIVLGTCAVLVAVAAGVVSLLLSVPRLAPVLIAASAVYMLYLAYKIATAPPLSRQSADARAPSFVEGFLLAIANPKAYVAIAAVFAGTEIAGPPPMAWAAIKVVVLALMIVIIHVCWLMLGVSFARFLSHPRVSRIANLAFAALLVATTALAIVH